jgi:hypothetical protein
MDIMIQKDKERFLLQEFDNLIKKYWLTVNEELQNKLIVEQFDRFHTKLEQNETTVWQLLLCQMELNVN